MIDKLQGLNENIGILMLESLRGSSDKSNIDSGMFNMVLENLFKAMKAQNQRTGNDLGDILLNNVAGSYNNIVLNNESLNEDERIAEAIDKYSAKYGVDPDLVSAIIKTESNFDSNAVSSAGAMGLTNAAKFTKNGTITLQFEVEKEKNRVLFAVAELTRQA